MKPVFDNTWWGGWGEGVNDVNIILRGVVA